jgi:hypothetical protein
MNIYLDGEYSRNNPLYHVEDSPWKAEQVLRMLKLSGLEPGSVCEVGCGAGEILHQLQLRMSPRTLFHGYDISPQAYALCKPRENERLTFFCEDLLSKETAPFDVLLCMDVIEHIEDYVGFLRKLRTKATHMIFHIPLDMSVQMVLRSSPIMRARTNVGHLHYFMKETALATLIDAGYEIERYFYTASGIDRAKSAKARLAKLPRTIFSRLSPDLTVRILGGYSLLVLAK